jgi:hypothetical protein
MAPYLAFTKGRRARVRPRCRAARVGRPAATCTSRDNLLAELADVIITAVIGMSGMTGVQWTEPAVSWNGAQLNTVTWRFSHSHLGLSRKARE